jgi:low affinity Fe/Cu permease
VDVYFTRIAGAIAAQAGRPLTFVLALACILIWAATGPLFGFSETWQLVINTGTTIITFLMVFLVQNTQNRDASAMQAKLDELLRSIEAARPDFIGIEHLTDSQIEQIRLRLEEEEGCGPDRIPSEEAVARLLERRSQAPAK